MVVGGGNSAGQATIYLANFASHVHVLIRGAELASTMSDYLVQRIGSSRNITLHTFSEITSLDGNEHLEAATWVNRNSGEKTTLKTSNIFIMIGADPCTDWLGGCVSAPVFTQQLTMDSIGLRSRAYLRLATYAPDRSSESHRALAKVQSSWPIFIAT